MPRLLDSRLFIHLSVLISLACSGGGGGGGGGVGAAGPRGGGRGAGCGSLGCEIVAADAAAFDQFGNAVATSGEVIVVGARLADDGGINRGSAYVYRSSGTEWVEEDELAAMDGGGQDFFGSSVAIDGDAIVVGARFDDEAGTDSGAAYVFRFNGASWQEEQKLLRADGAMSDEFGFSVAIDGDVIVVGAVFAGDEFEGAAYVYRFNGATWIEEQRLSASNDADPGLDYFGGAVSVSGDVIVVGSRFDDEDGTNSGSAYVFSFDGAAWMEEQELTASDAAEGDGFGITAAVSGDVVVVGSVFDDHAGGEDSGSAYVFAFDGGSWVEEQKLIASDAAANDQFGVSVGIDGDVILVGSALDDDGGTDSGSAYVFDFGGTSWAEVQKLVASDPGPGDEFGFSVSVADGVHVAGASLAAGLAEDDDGNMVVIEESGSAYAFD